MENYFFKIGIIVLLEVFLLIVIIFVINEKNSLSKEILIVGCYLDNRIILRLGEFKKLLLIISWWGNNFL